MGLQLVVPLWLLQPSLLFHISQVRMTSLGPHPIIFSPPKVQKVLKSLSLENCQAFIKRTELLFLCYFYLLCQKRHHVALAVVYCNLPSMWSCSGQNPGLLQPGDVQHVADCSSTVNPEGLDYFMQ